LDGRPKHYLANIAFVTVLTVAGWIGFVMLGDSWWQLLVAAYLAFCQVQTGLLLHDSGHNQIFRSLKANKLTYYICGNLLLGISGGWWVSVHNRHHSHPNHLTKDPALARRAATLASGISRDSGHLSLARRTAVYFEAVIFFPRYTLTYLGMRIISIVALCRRQVHRITFEAALTAIHFGLYTTALLLTLPPEKSFAFVVINCALAGLYLGAILTPNHTGMLVRDGEELDWVHRQVLTTRNLRSTRLTDFLHGGLGFHIEHHLFPAMPRPNLHKARSIVIGYCRENEIDYRETSVIRSYLEIVTYLTSSVKLKSRKNAHM
jgi:fatty acid desaturase